MEGGEGVIVCFLRYTPPILRPRTRLRAKLYVHEKYPIAPYIPFTFLAGEISLLYTQSAVHIAWEVDGKVEEGVKESIDSLGRSIGGRKMI